MDKPPADSSKYIQLLAEGGDSAEINASGVVSNDTTHAPVQSTESEVILSQDLNSLISGGQIFQLQNGNETLQFIQIIDENGQQQFVQLEGIEQAPSSENQQAQVLLTETQDAETSEILTGEIEPQKMEEGKMVMLEVNKTEEGSVLQERNNVESPLETPQININWAQQPIEKTQAPQMAGNSSITFSNTPLIEDKPVEQSFSSQNSLPSTSTSDFNITSTSLTQPESEAQIITVIKKEPLVGSRASAQLQTAPQIIRMGRDGKQQIISNGSQPVPNAQTTPTSSTAGDANFPKIMTSSVVKSKPEQPKRGKFKKPISKSQRRTLKKEFQSGGKKDLSPIDLKEETLVKINGRQCRLRMDPISGEMKAYPVVVAKPFGTPASMLNNPSKGEAKEKRKKKKISKGNKESKAVQGLLGLAKGPNGSKKSLRKRKKPWQHMKDFVVDPLSKKVNEKDDEQDFCSVPYKKKSGEEPALYKKKSGEKPALTERGITPPLSAPSPSSSPPPPPSPSPPPPSPPPLYRPEKTPAPSNSAASKLKPATVKGQNRLQNYLANLGFPVQRGRGRPRLKTNLVEEDTPTFVLPGPPGTPGHTVISIAPEDGKFEPNKRMIHVMAPKDLPAVVRGPDAVNQFPDATPTMLVQNKHVSPMASRTPVLVEPDTPPPPIPELLTEHDDGVQVGIRQDGMLTVTYDKPAQIPESSSLMVANPSKYVSILPRPPGGAPPPTAKSQSKPIAKPPSVLPPQFVTMLLDGHSALPANVSDTTSLQTGVLQQKNVVSDMHQAGPSHIGQVITRSPNYPQQQVINKAVSPVIGGMKLVNLQQRPVKQITSEQSSVHPIASKLVLMKTGNLYNMQSQVKSPPQINASQVIGSHQSDGKLSNMADLNVSQALTTGTNTAVPRFGTQTNDASCQLMQSCTHRNTSNRQSISACQACSKEQKDQAQTNKSIIRKDDQLVPSVVDKFSAKDNSRQTLQLGDKTVYLTVQGQGPNTFVSNVTMTQVPNFTQEETGTPKSKKATVTRNVAMPQRATALKSSPSVSMPQLAAISKAAPSASIPQLAAVSKASPLTKKQHIAISSKPGPYISVSQSAAASNTNPIISMPRLAAKPAPADTCSQQHPLVGVKRKHVLEADAVTVERSVKDKIRIVDCGGKKYMLNDNHTSMKKDKFRLVHCGNKRYTVVNDKDSTVKNLTPSMIKRSFSSDSHSSTMLCSTEEGPPKKLANLPEAERLMVHMPKGKVKVVRIVKTSHPITEKTAKVAPRLPNKQNEGAKCVGDKLKINHITIDDDTVGPSYDDDMSSIAERPINQTKTKKAEDKSDNHDITIMKESSLDKQQTKSAHEKKSINSGVPRGYIRIVDEEHFEPNSDVLIDVDIEETRVSNITNFVSKPEDDVTKVNEETPMEVNEIIKDIKSVVSSVKKKPYEAHGGVYEAVEDGVVLIDVNVDDNTTSGNNQPDCDVTKVVKVNTSDTHKSEGNTQDDRTGAGSIDLQIENDATQEESGQTDTNDIDSQSACDTADNMRCAQPQGNDSSTNLTCENETSINLAQTEDVNTGTSNNGESTSHTDIDSIRNTEDDFPADNDSVIVSGRENLYNAATHVNHDDSMLTRGRESDTYTSSSVTQYILTNINETVATKKDNDSQNEENKTGSGIIHDNLPECEGNEAEITAQASNDTSKANTQIDSDDSPIDPDGMGLDSIVAESASSIQKNAAQAEICVNSTKTQSDDSPLQRNDIQASCIDNITQVEQTQSDCNTAQVGATLSGDTTTTSTIIQEHDANSVPRDDDENEEIRQPGNADATKTFITVIHQEVDKAQNPAVDNGNMDFTTESEMNKTDAMETEHELPEGSVPLETIDTPIDYDSSFVDQDVTEYFDTSDEIDIPQSGDVVNEMSEDDDNDDDYVPDNDDVTDDDGVTANDSDTTNDDVTGNDDVTANDDDVTADDEVIDNSSADNAISNMEGKDKDNKKIRPLPVLNEITVMNKPEVKEEVKTTNFIMGKDSKEVSKLLREKLGEVNMKEVVFVETESGATGLNMKVLPIVLAKDTPAPPPPQAPAKPAPLQKIGLRTKESDLAQFKCSLCNFQAYFQEQFTEHVASHTDVETHKCKCCHFRCFDEASLIEHFKKNHPKCICTVCNFMAEQRYVVKRHMQRHDPDSCTCPLCGKKYKDQYILKMHQQMVHMPAEVLFECEVCEKKFTRKAHLKRHLRIHDPVKPFKCPHCDYRGCERSDISKHILVHSEPRYVCPVCDKAFRHIKNKELHMKRHRGQRDYKCGVCDFYGYTFTDIRKHIERKHADRNTLLCGKCGLAFQSEPQLQIHSAVCRPEDNALVTSAQPLSDVINQETGVAEPEINYFQDGGASQSALPDLNDPEVQGQLLDTAQFREVISTTTGEEFLNTPNEQLITQGEPVVTQGNQLETHVEQLITQEEHSAIRKEHLISQNSHLMTQGEHLVTQVENIDTSQGHLVSEDGQFVTTQNYELMTEEGQSVTHMVSQSEHLVTQDENLVSHSELIISEQEQSSFQ